METPIKRNLFEQLFSSPGEKRLRAGWRLLLQLVMMGIFLCIIAFPVLWFGPGKSQTWLIFFSILAECFAITVSVFYARRFIDKRSFASLGLSPDKFAIRDFLAGLGIALLMFALITIMGYLMKWVAFTSFAWQEDGFVFSAAQSLVWLGIFIMVAWQEELFSRGYWLQNIRDGLNLTWAVILSSAVFSCLHLLNPGASWGSTFGIFFAGLFLAFGYVVTRQLWLPIGLHLGWNLFEGVLFGFPVSGVNTYALIRITVTGPKIWTGGVFGPEAGLLLIPALILGAGLVYGYGHLPGNRNG
jgi:uncharacterized protein